MARRCGGRIKWRSDGHAKEGSQQPTVTEGLESRRRRSPSVAVGLRVGEGRRAGEESRAGEGQARQDQARQGKASTEGHVSKVGREERRQAGSSGSNPTFSLVWQSGSLAVWQSGSLAVWLSGTCSWPPHDLAASTSLQHLEARPRDAEAAATRFRTTGAFLSSPRIAPGHQVLPSRLVQTPPSALCTLPTFNIATVCGTFGHLSLPSSLVRGLGRNSSSVLLRGRSHPTEYSRPKRDEGFPKDRVVCANDTWQGKASD
jgi:hypothetical protein